MSDAIVLRNGGQLPTSSKDEAKKFGSASESGATQSSMPTLDSLALQRIQASQLIEDIVLKKYLNKLSSLEIVPLEDSLKQISNIRLFKINEMVYQKDEYSTYKFASVFSALQNLNCGIFIVADSNGQKTDFYMGVRSLDNERTTKSLKDTLKNALVGQFPGVKTADLLDAQAEEFLATIPERNIASVSCVANNKDEDFKDNQTFIQGLEKLALAMQGQRYTAIVLARSMPAEELEKVRCAYEAIYTQLSPFANLQMSYGTNEAITISDALSKGTTTGTSYSKNTSTSQGTTYSRGTAHSDSTSTSSIAGTLAKGIGLGAAAVLSAVQPLAGFGLGAIMGAWSPSTKSSGVSSNENSSVSNTSTRGETFGKSSSHSESSTHTQGRTSGQSQNMQLTMQNKTLHNDLERIDAQLKRLNECESLGMWECAAYFLADNQEVAEMAAGTYKALMKGAQSGLETSAINYWGRRNQKDLPVLREYITNFIHPIFAYKAKNGKVPVTAASLSSSNELAIQMGLPRKSVCGFPVVEHADFGKEVVAYGHEDKSRSLELGHIFSMGSATETKVKLDVDSLTMHTFVTGSTGSGKSNTVYEILGKLHSLYNIPFLVVEPAKGEYKHVFGQYPDVSIYGTNPKKTALLRLNVFSFPEDIHILEHLDRLVEIFNVCWPMYAAMPAILKEAIERAYSAAGWDLVTSENKQGQKYPNFADVLEQIETVIEESKYSADCKGDYAGALLTRVRSLTTGLNGLIFSNEEISNADLFDKSVIVDLSRVGSVETKSLIMGLLVMKLNEYRLSSGCINSQLTHLTVLEEAHNLLKRTSTEQISEGANLLGKSVEMLANSIAEMRTYGEGFIIADQSPGMLDMSVIRNTNTKILLRLPDRSDRELVGYAASLNSAQVDELSKLKRGVAAVYQNDWVEPVLVQIEKFADFSPLESSTASSPELEVTVEQKQVEPLKSRAEIITEPELGQETKEHEAPSLVSSADKEKLREQLIRFLIHGRLPGQKLNFSIEDLEKNLYCLALSSTNQGFVEELLEEYKENPQQDLGQDKFDLLSRRIVSILDFREKVKNCVLTSSTDSGLTNALKDLALQVLPNASNAEVMALSQCFMKDFSTQRDEKEIKTKLYLKWVHYVKQRRIK